MQDLSENTRFLKLLKQFNSLLLIYSDDAGELQVTPKRVLEQEEEGTLWFALSENSPEASYIHEFGQIQIAGQDGDSRFVAVNGPAIFDLSLAEKRKRWTEELRAAFPGGAEDPNFALLKVIPHQGEYWDHAGANRLLYLADALGAYILNRQPHGSDRRHGRVNF